MPKTIFYRNFKKITQYGTTEKKPGSGRPQALNPDKRSLYQRALQYPLSSTAKITGSKGCSSVHAHCLSNFEDGRHFQEKTTENSLADRRPKQNRFSFYQTWLVDNFFATVFITDESYFQLYRNRILHWFQGKSLWNLHPNFARKLWRGVLSAIVDFILNVENVWGILGKTTLKRKTLKIDRTWRGSSWNRSEKLHSNCREIWWTLFQTEFATRGNIIE